MDRRDAALAVASLAETGSSGLRWSDRRLAIVSRGSEPANVAGIADDHSNQTTRSLADAVHIFKNAVVTEKSTAQLEALVEHLRTEKRERSAERSVKTKVASRFGTETIKEMVARYNAGESMSAIATKWQISVSATRGLLRQHGAAIRQHR